ncbi:MAG TPA: AAA family ATPase [Terriglobales bacterium]|nr:AAA family ATPase [Terriglobales bacterium]
MYEKFFGFSANPFSVSPDPRFLCRTRHTDEALASLAYGIVARKGFILLTGEVGTGKTTLLNKFLDWLRITSVSTAFIFNPRLEPLDFLAFTMSEFGIRPEGNTKGAMVLQLYHWLLERYRNGQKAVLVVDEAQTLSSDLLEEIRLLTNLETSTAKLLQVVLCGQPELEDKLKLPELRQLRQRVVLWCRTYPLSLEETTKYIDRRLRVVGASSNPLGPESLRRIHVASGGIPRVINLVCEHALIAAFADRKTIVTPDMVDRVVRELDLGDTYARPAGETAVNVQPIRQTPAIQREPDIVQPATGGNQTI